MAYKHKSPSQDQISALQRDKLAPNTRMQSPGSTPPRQVPAAGHENIPIERSKRSCSFAKFSTCFRQTEGLMKSLSRLMKAEIAIPDFSSISKRSIDLARHVLSKAMEPGSLVIVDSTSLKIYGKDEWHQEKHAVPARRTGANRILPSMKIIKFWRAN